MAASSSKWKSNSEIIQKNEQKSTFLLKLSVLTPKYIQEWPPPPPPHVLRSLGAWLGVQAVRIWLNVVVIVVNDGNVVVAAVLRLNLVVCTWIKRVNA